MSFISRICRLPALLLVAAAVTLPSDKVVAKDIVLGASGEET
jgi:hypothetical protein